MVVKITDDVEWSGKFQILEVYEFGGTFEYTISPVGSSIGYIFFETELVSLQKLRKDKLNLINTHNEKEIK